MFLLTVGNAMGICALHISLLLFLLVIAKATIGGVCCLLFAICCLLVSSLFLNRFCFAIDENGIILRWSGLGWRDVRGRYYGA